MDAERKKQRARERREEWLKQGRCYACREHWPVVEGRTYCEVCAEQRKRYARRRYRKMRISNLCVVCRRPVEPELEGRAYCRDCAERQRVYMQNWKKSEGARAEVRT